MEFTNETLLKMKEKQQYNKVFSNFYYGMSRECLDEGLEVESNKFLSRSERIKDCLDYWFWDKYERNKLLDLKKVNRCKNNRFCPNCKKFELAKFIHHFKPIFFDLFQQGYNPYLMTLTVPNVRGEDLGETIDKMNKAFSKFFKLFNRDVENGKDGFKGRLITFDGALKVLEITYNENMNTFHPHFHVLVLSTEYSPTLFNKSYQGEWSYKRNSYNMYSELDLQVQKLWYMVYNKIRISEKNYVNLNEYYLCDIREMDEKGLYELLKYTFKDTDVKNYYVFKMLVRGLERKRVRQGYGVLYNVKCEDIDDGEKIGIEQFLEIDKKENPEDIITPGISKLIKEYHEYRKISRFKAYDNLTNLD